MAARDSSPTVLTTVPRYENAGEREYTVALPCLTTAHAFRRFRLEETRNPATEGARAHGKHPLVEELYAGGRFLSTVDYKKKKNVCDLSPFLLTTVELNFYKRTLTALLIAIIVLSENSSIFNSMLYICTRYKHSIVRYNRKYI